MNILVYGGNNPPPPPDQRGGEFCPSPERGQKIAAATHMVTMAAHPACTSAGRASIGALQPSALDSFPRRARPLANQQHNIGSVLLHEPGRSVTSMRKSSISSRQQLYILMICLFFLSRVISTARPAACLPRRATVQHCWTVQHYWHVVPKSQQGVKFTVNHSQQP